MTFAFMTLPVNWRFALAVFLIIGSLIALAVVRSKRPKGDDLVEPTEPTAPEPEPRRDNEDSYDYRERVREFDPEREDPEYAAAMRTYRREMSGYTATEGDRMKAAELDRKVRRPALISLIVGVVFLVLSCVNLVGTKQVAIVTSFGSPGGSYGSGPHLQWPWDKTHEIDGRIQTDSYTGDHCIWVQMGGDARGCIDTTVRWRVPKDNSSSLYADYGSSMERIRDSVVRRDLEAALFAEFGTLDPLAALEAAADAEAAAREAQEQGETPPETELTSTSINMAARSDEVLERLMSVIDDRVILDPDSPLTLAGVRWDDDTQSRINELMSQVADTRIEGERENTAANTAAANRELASSVSNDPNVLVATCFDIWRTYAEDGVALPAASSCWPGGQPPATVAVPTGPPSGG